MFEEIEKMRKWKPEIRLYKLNVIRQLGSTTKFKAETDSNLKQNEHLVFRKVLNNFDEPMSSKCQLIAVK